MAPGLGLWLWKRRVTSIPGRQHGEPKTSRSPKDPLVDVSRALQTQACETFKVIVRFSFQGPREPHGSEVGAGYHSYCYSDRQGQRLRSDSRSLVLRLSSVCGGGWRVCGLPNVGCRCPSTRLAAASLQARLRTTPRLVPARGSLRHPVPTELAKRVRRARSSVR